MHLVINTKGTFLRRRKERFLIRRDGVAHEFAAAKIDTIVVATGVHFTSDVVQLTNQHIVSVHRARIGPSAVARFTTLWGKVSCSKLEWRP